MQVDSESISYSMGCGLKFYGQTQKFYSSSTCECCINQISLQLTFLKASRSITSLFRYLWVSFSSSAPFFKIARGGGAEDLLVSVYFLPHKQRLRPLGYCAPISSIAPFVEAEIRRHLLLLLIFSQWPWCLQSDARSSKSSVIYLSSVWFWFWSINAAGFFLKPNGPFNGWQPSHWGL